MTNPANPSLGLQLGALSDWKMHRPHKKCYKGNAILMGSMRWVVKGGFNREGKNKRIYPVMDPILAAPKPLCKQK